MCKQKGTKNLITAKSVLQSRTLRPMKGIMNGQEAKATVQTTIGYNVMHRLEHVPKDVMQKQAKCKWQ